MTEKHSRAALIAQLISKVEEQDWAGVSDVAQDLRLYDILEARSRVMPRRSPERRPGDGAVA